LIKVSYRSIKTILKMKEENESNQNENGQTKKPESQPRASLMNTAVKLIRFRREQEIAKLKEKEAQLAKKGEEVESPKVGTENSQSSNPELPKRVSVLTKLATVMAAKEKAKEQEAQQAKK
jgi:hypothetical protein